MCVCGGGGKGGINPNRLLTISGLRMLDSSCSVMGPLKDLDSCMPTECVCGGRGVTHHIWFEDAGLLL